MKQQHDIHPVMHPLLLAAGPLSTQPAVYVCNRDKIEDEEPEAIDVLHAHR